MSTVLFCIPLKENHLAQFKQFVEETSEKKTQEWKDMLARYDMSCVKLWHKNIEGREYAFVYHEIGPSFEEKIKHWNDSQNEFDQWFNQQIMAIYDDSAIDSHATNLLELIV